MNEISHALDLHTWPVQGPFIVLSFITVMFAYISVIRNILCPFPQSPSQNSLPSGPLCTQRTHLISSHVH